MPSLTIVIDACPGCCGTPKTCHDLYGDTLIAVISGINTCDDCYTLGSAPAQDFEFTFTGINTTVTLTWDAGTSTWINAHFGSLTELIFPSSDGTCTGDPEEFDGDATITAQCTGDNQFLVTITGNDFPFPFGIFANDGTGTLGDALANVNVACPPATDGHVTLGL